MLDQDLHEHRQAFLNFAVQAEKKAGKGKTRPVYRKFRQFFDYDTELKKIKSRKKKIEGRFSGIRELLKKEGERMAESFSVKAILSAADKGFTSAMKSASGYADNLKSTLTSGLGFGVMMAAGQKAFDVVSNGVTGLIGDMNDASAAWKTFQGNMEMNGHTAKEIKSIKGELQDFAEATIYSSSDMASTFAQLEAVGTKNTTKLVKGFGGLAAAAENPTQAMKTLSQQATQMAAKPK